MQVIASADSTILDAWRSVLGESSLVELRRLDGLANCLLHLRPELVLLDVRLVRANPIRAVTELRKAHAEAAIIVFVSDEDDEDLELALLRAGARGICRLDVAAELLGKAVAAVTRGELWVRRALMPRLIDGLMADCAQASSMTSCTGRFAVLTPREIEIVKLVGQGSSNKGIARHLAIAERTVKGHLTAIFRKTGIVDRVKLALLIARRH